MRKCILLIFLLAFSQALRSQQVLLDSAQIDAADEYTSLSEALKTPEQVFKLSLRKQKLKEFPKQVLKLTNLQYLDISKNDIETLPDSIVVLKNLQYLIVSKTGLKSLPANIGELKHLKHLNANQNDLERLPESFGNLENLRYADLWSNNLEYFPPTMKDLSNLKKMDLRNILIPKDHQDSLQNALPNTKIYFSPPCNCAW